MGNKKVWHHVLKIRLTEIVKLNIQEKNPLMFFSSLISYVDALGVL